MKFLIPIFFFMVAIVGMLAALQFSKYKKRKTGCCGAHAECSHHRDKKEESQDDCS